MAEEPDLDGPEVERTAPITWTAGGVWMVLLHTVGPRAKRQTVGSTVYWWAQCGATCVQLPSDYPVATVPLCESCFPYEHHDVAEPLPSWNPLTPNIDLEKESSVGSDKALEQLRAAAVEAAKNGNAAEGQNLAALAKQEEERRQADAASTDGTE